MFAVFKTPAAARTLSFARRRAFSDYTPFGKIPTNSAKVGTGNPEAVLAAGEAGEAGGTDAN